MRLSRILPQCSASIILLHLERKNTQGTIVRMDKYRWLSDLRVPCVGLQEDLYTSEIMTTYGIGHTDAINSFWYVVDAISSHPNFKIAYPEEHDKQQSIAEGFRQVSGANFACCPGAIDGILIWWIHKPSERDCAKSGCSSGKFMCARKSLVKIVKQQ